MPRSLSIHTDHRPLISQSLSRNGFLTQGDLAANLEIALSTVNNFCRGIKVSVSKFEQICEALNLDPREIILPAVASSPVEPSLLSHPEDSRKAYFSYDSFWVGRQTLSDTLMTKLTGPCRLLLITGLSGIGKTALSERLSERLAVTLSESTPYLRLQENFDNEEQPADFISVAARLLEGGGQPISPEARSNPKQLTRQLVTYLQTHPCLVLMDSLEKVMHSRPQTQWSEFQDPGFVTFFKAILASNDFPSRFILTSQERPAQLAEVGSRYQNFWHTQPISGLNEQEQIALFDKTGFTSSEGTIPTDLIRIGKAYEGHPLALRTILGEISDKPFFGNVHAYWKRHGKEIEEVEKSLAEAASGNTTGADDKWQLDRFTRALQLNVQQRLEHTFARLRQDAKYAYVLLCESSVYRCPVPDDWWLIHLEDWEQSEAIQLEALEALRDRYLVEEKIEDTDLLLKQHNLIRSISLAHLKALTFDI